MRKRISKYKHLHSNRFRYLSSSIPLICASGLLVTFGIMIAPLGSFSNGEVYADITMSSSGSGSSTSTNSTVSIELDEPKVTDLSVGATTSEIAYISKGFTVTASNNYNIYVQTTNNSSDLTNGKTVVRSIAGSNVAPASFTDNTWGYTVADNKPSESSLTYNAIPTNTTNAIKSGNDAAAGKQFTLAFAAKFGSGATAGHYKTGIVLSVAAEPGEVTTLYSVSYSTNGSTGGVTPATQTAESSSATYTFMTPLQGDMIKEDFKFLGWSEDPRALTPQYEPNSQITLSMSSPSKTLYAVWARGLLDVDNMNELTPFLCKISAINDTKQLKDTRDNKMYWVTKLADGNCWMTQNLDYNDPNSTKLDTPSEWDNDAALSKTYYDPGDYFYSNTSSWSRCNTATGLSDSSCKNAGWATSGDGHFHVGNYYSWSTVLGGDKENNNAVSGICAEGWKLPRIGNVSGSFGSSLGESVVSGPSLTSAYYVTSSAAGAAIMRNAPMYFIPSGYLYSGKLDAGTDGFYWTSTAYSTNQNGYFLALSSEKVDPRSSWLSSYIGHSVRCLVLGS